MKTRQEFFKHYVKYAAISHALWRCYECERFSRENLKGPVLDLGCGDGFFAEAVFGHLDVGIDLDKEEVSRAARRGVYDRVVVGNATQMPFKKNMFNTVISNCVMEHIPDIDLVLSEVYRVLKPGGRLITSVPSEYWDADSFYQKSFNAVGFNQASQWYNRVLNKISKHYHVDNLNVWNERFRKAGLKLKSSEYIVPIRVYHAFERWLITGSLTKISKAFFKRWLLWPRWGTPTIYSWWFKDLLEADWDKGACYYLVAVKPGNKSSRK